MLRQSFMGRASSPVASIYAHTRFHVMVIGPESGVMTTLVVSWQIYLASYPFCPHISVCSYLNFVLSPLYVYQTLAHPNFILLVIYWTNLGHGTTLNYLASQCDSWYMIVGSHFWGSWTDNKGRHPLPTMDSKHMWVVSCITYDSSQSPHSFIMIYHFSHV